MIADILAGNHELYYELIAPLERRLYFAAYEILRSQEEAEDATQEAILKGFRNLSQFRGEARFSTWIFSITLNEARARLRRNREIPINELNAGDSEESDYIPIELADWREIPSETLDRKEVAAQVAKAIASLPPIYREVLVIRDIENLSIAEAAEALNITPANVKVRLLRARLMLRDAFVANNFTDVSSRRGWKSLMIQLSCEDVRHEISNYIENDISPKKRKMIDAHLEQCKRCAVLIDSVHNMVILIADERRFSLPGSLNERLHKPLVAEVETAKKRGAIKPRA